MLVPHHRNRSGLPIAFAVALLVYGLLQVNGRFLITRDSLPYRTLPAALIQNGTFRLDGFPELAGEGNYAVVRDRTGHLISKKPVLPVALMIPPWLVFRALHGRWPAGEVEPMELAKAAGCLGAALAAAATVLALGAAGLRRRWLAPAAALGMVFLTPLWFTAMDCWPHPLVAALNAFSLWIVLRSGNRGVGRGSDPTCRLEEPACLWFWVGLAQGLAIAARLGAAAVALVFAAAALLMRNAECGMRNEMPPENGTSQLTAHNPQLTTHNPFRIPHSAFRMGFMLAGMAGPLALLGWYNAHYFGSPLAQGFGGQALQRLQAPWAGLAGLLFSPAKGIFIFSPVAVLVFWGWRDGGGRRRGAMLCAAAIAAHLLYWSFYADWLGGWAFGPRYLADVAPLGALLAAAGLDRLLTESRRHRFVRAAAAALAGVSLLFQLAGMFMWDGDYHRVYDRGFGTGRQAWVWQAPPEPLWLLDRRVWYEPFYYREKQATIK